MLQQPGGSIRNSESTGMHKIKPAKEEDKTITVHTDSMRTLDSLFNTDKHTFLTEEIRQTVHELETREWKILFRWVQAHAGTSGIELADKLTKEASGKKDMPISYKRVPKTVI
jgi:ribonuclease HI